MQDSLPFRRETTFVRGRSIFYDWPSTRDVSAVFVNALNAKANIYPRWVEDLVKY